ncbi:MAG: ATP-binding protein [Ruminococcus sp.]
MDKSEIYEKALNIIQKRRIDAINENQRRIEEVNTNVPEINEFNAHLYNTSHEIFRIISEGKNVEQRIAELKKSNLDIQRLIKSTLRTYNYPPDYLSIKYCCSDCNDTGYKDGHYCHCFMELVGKISADEMNKSSQIKLSSFETFSLDYYSGDDYTIMKKIFEKSKNFAENFGNDNESILMIGNTGLGKTHLSLAIANEVLKKGYIVIYDSVINILHKIEAEHFGRDKINDTLSLINDVDLLILDDLGMEYTSSFYVSMIYNIINTRLNKSKSTIINSNLTMKEMIDKYSTRITSRLSTMYTCMLFSGRDVRSQKKQRGIQ